jgi:hypothetical protein
VPEDRPKIDQIIVRLEEDPKATFEGADVNEVKEFQRRCEAELRVQEKA